MNMITLEKPSQSEVTILSNIFIDHYMPQANGEFVKVYIYLLRARGNAGLSFSLEEMADQLLCTERDILRALKYWAKTELLSLTYTSDKKLSGIIMAPPGSSGVSCPETAAAAQPQEPQLQEPQPQETQPQEMQSASAPSVQPLTPDRVRELKQNEEIVQLLYIAEQYLGKTLTTTEIQKLLFFYDGLKFSADLIEYLIEYCVSKNHKNFRYIETVALAWAKDGISTVQEAKSNVSRYGKDYFTILKALGISNRNPVDTEIVLMDTWLQSYGFSMEIIQEACSRTVLQTGQPSFQYTDKILKGWKKKNVHSLADIQILDAEHKKRRQSTAAASQPAPAANRFNNFQQRNYNFTEYEKRLLNQ